MTTDYKRLGKRGAYRLGRLRVQGTGGPQHAQPFRPRFSHSDHRWPASHWLAGLAAGVLVIIVGTADGIWFMPFIAGLAGGCANWVGNWPERIALPWIALAGALGWGIPLWWATVHGQADGAVAREVAALTGLPGYAAAGVLLTVAISAAQALAGYWLGRSVFPRATR
jgi:hypothetical protein